MRTRSYQLCTRCVMDTTDLEITFDEKGWCNHCTGFLNKGTRHKYQGEESDRALDDVIDAIKRSGKRAEYDCIIGVSGGADSSYMAYIAKQRGLRPLAVHMRESRLKHLVAKQRSVARRGRKYDDQRRRA